MRSNINPALTKRVEKSFIDQSFYHFSMSRSLIISIFCSILTSSIVSGQQASGTQDSSMEAAKKTYDPLMTTEMVEKEFGAETALFPPVIPEGTPIKSVSFHFVGAERFVNEERLKNIVSSQAGTSYSSAAVQKDIERLMKSGLVTGNIAVRVKNEGNGIGLIFDVSSQKLLGGVGFRGVNGVNLDDVASETKLKNGQPLSDQSISDAVQNIRKYYLDANYPDVKVSYSFQKTERPGYLDLVFNIQEGPEAKIVNIDFIGNRAISSVDLRKTMRTKQSDWLTWFTGSGKIDREVIEDDLSELLTYYRNKGYLKAQITKVEYLNHAKKPNEQRLRMKVYINEGIKYKVNKVAFGPTTVFTTAELVPGLSMYNGDTYSAKKVADDVTMIRRYYGSRGYADANVVPDISVVDDGAKNGVGRIDIVYRVTEGSPYKVANINLNGNRKTKDYVIRQELPLQSNSPLNSVDLDTAKKRLTNLNYFDHVDVSQAATSLPGYRDINIEVREKGTGMLNVGVAFSSIESVYLFMNVTQRNFDLYDWSSFVGGGQRLNVGGRVGLETQEANVSWIDPWFLHRKLALGVDIFYSDSTYFSDYYRQENYGFGLSLRKPLGELDYIKLDYRLEQYRILPEWDAPLFFLLQHGDYVRSHLELSYAIDTRDAQMTTRRGGKFEVLGGWSGLGGDVKTYNAGINASYYWNLRGDTIFSVNGALAVIDSYGDKEVPIFERLYLGGPNNLRGFRFRDVAPYIPGQLGSGDETMGGKTSAFVQFEYSIPVIEQIRLAIFYDIGFVNAKAGDFSTKNIASDIGIGLRLNLPIGPLAVDYAIPMKTGNAIDKGGQFQFYVNYSY